MLRIGLQEDPDLLDPVRANTFVGRVVFAALCDKLVDINERLEIVPQLATEWSWSADGLTLTMRLRSDARFHDGDPVTAEAVKANLDRARTQPDSRRRSELASIEEVTVAGPHELRIRVARPDATLLAQFTDRAGMIASPRAFGPELGARPVCSGPYRFVERVQNDRIVLERVREHWRANRFHFDRIVYRAIPDNTVRLANLRAGDIDMLERMAPSDVRSAERDANLRVARVTSLGYQGITFNIANGPRADNPAGRDKRVRQALSLSLDREALNQVVFEGLYTPTIQPLPPASFAHDPALGVPPRDVERARRLLREAGHERVTLEVQVGNSAVQQQVMQVIQAMAGEAGFDIRIRATEFATMIRDQNAGNFQVNQVGWSGRPDPDGNTHVFWRTGGGQNDGRYSNPEMDRLLDAARAATDNTERRRHYHAAMRIALDELPIVYLYFPQWIFAMNRRLDGFTPVPDGIIRLDDVRLAR
jgi:peptide/nickel transport system substrate-binding protein